MPRKNTDSAINNVDMNVGLDMALSTKPMIPVRFAFEPKVVSIATKKPIFSVKEIAEFIYSELKESDGVIYRDNIILSLKDYGLDDSQINQVFGYGINNKLFTVSSNNKIVKLVKDSKIVSVHSNLVASEPEVISFSKYQESLLVEEKVTYKQRKTFSDLAFAWPEKRKYLIHDASHARNAMVRLNAAYKKGYVTKQEYHKIRDNILKAYIKFGIKAKQPPVGVINIKKHKKMVKKSLKMAAERPCF